MRRQFITSLAAAVVSLLAQAPARSATLVYIPAPVGGPTPMSVDAVSGDGTVAAGSLVAVPGQSHLYRWTRDGGTVDLGRPLGRNFHSVTDVSGDGGTIVGWANDDLATGPWRVALIRWPSRGVVLSDVVAGAAAVTGGLRGALGGRVVADRVTAGASAAAAAARRAV